MESFFKNISFTMDGAPNITNQDCPAGDSTVKTVAKAVAYFTILIVSLVGNTILILAITKSKQLRKSINYFVFNMAVSDLLNPLTILPIKIVQIISESASWKVDSPWLLGNILCKLSFFLPDVSLVVSIESLLLISMDRFVAVVFPLKAYLISSKVRLMAILCTWIVAIVVHAPYFYAVRLSSSENETSCIVNWGPAFNHIETQKRFATATFIIFFIVPIGVLAIVYGTMAWTFRRKNKKNKQRLGCRQRLRDEQHKKIVRMSVAIIIAFAFCMIPLFVFVFVRIFLWNWQLPPICAFQTVIPFIVYILLHSWSAVNPCVCFIFNKNYWQGFKQIPSFHSSHRASASGVSLRMETKMTSISKRLSK